MSELEHILPIQNKLGEGPLWDAAKQVLYWVDIEKNCFFRFDPVSGKYDTFDAGLSVGVLALRTNGALIMATQKGFAFWNDQTRTPKFIADPEAHIPTSRFNDGAVDRKGRFWAGTIDQGPTSSLYRLDPDLTVHTMETGITVSNGIGWSPDNKTMYFTDSTPRVIYAYDFDFDSGAIENRRPFITISEGAGVPDGLTVDSEGFVWSAIWNGWRLCRFDPAGKLEREVRMPVERPTSVKFGGKDLDELYITSCGSGFDVKQKQEQPWVGDLFRLKPGVKGLPEPRFAG